MEKSNRNKQVYRIGILLESLEGKANLDALRFFILQLNTLQTNIVFEIFPLVSKSEFIDELKSTKSLDRLYVINESIKFIQEYHSSLKKFIVDYEIEEGLPPYWIILTLNKFKDNYYTARTDKTSIIALGDWKRSMAPPSIAEFFVVLIIRETLAIIVPSLRKSIHLGTKGCLCDFTYNLNEVRYKVLEGYICDFCRQRILEECTKEFLDEITFISNIRKWVGTIEDFHSPARIMSSMGYNLFLTKGLKQNFWESLLTNVQQEGIKQIISIVGQVLLVILLLWLGLSGG